MAGCVHLVGAGPGDPELLTLKAARRLAHADVVVYDRLVHPDILRHARPGARLVFAGKTGARGDGPHTDQEQIHRRLIAWARAGRDVVRLKGGDPFVFGRGGEEALALLRAGVPFDVVPGVTSGVAAPAAAGIPVTHRGLATDVTFATARLSAGEREWRKLAAADTLVLFMCGQKLAASAAALVAAGRAERTPCAVVEAGSWPETTVRGDSIGPQRVVTGTLADIAARAPRVGSPALLVVGEVVSLRARLAEQLSPLVQPAPRPRRRAA